MVIQTHHPTQTRKAAKDFTAFRNRGLKKQIKATYFLIYVSAPENTSLKLAISVGPPTLFDSNKY